MSESRVAPSIYIKVGHAVVEIKRPPKNKESK